MRVRPRGTLFGATVAMTQSDACTTCDTENGTAHLQLVRQSVQYNLSELPHLQLRPRTYPSLPAAIQLMTPPALPVWALYHERSAQRTTPTNNTSATTLLGLTITLEPISRFSFASLSFKPREYNVCLGERKTRDTLAVLSVIRSTRCRKLASPELNKYKPCLHPR